MISSHRTSLCTTRAQTEHLKSSDFAHGPLLHCSSMSRIDVLEPDLRNRQAPIFLGIDGSMFAHGDGSLPSYPICAFVGDQENKLKLAMTIQDMCSRHLIKPWTLESPLPRHLYFPELAKSFYIACSQNITSTPLDVRLHPYKHPPYTGTVHVVLLTVQLERQSSFGMPFAMVVFEPEDETKVIRIKTAKQHKHKQARCRAQPQVLEAPQDPSLSTLSIKQHINNLSAKT